MNIEISLLGYVVIPVGLVMFFKSKRQLFWATVASIPFFSVDIIDLSFTRIQVFEYFGLLLVLRRIVQMSLTRDRRSMSISPTSAAVLCFLLVTFLSLFMPAVLRDSIYVLSLDTGYQDYENVELLRFGIKNLSQVVFPTFMILLFLSLVKEIRDRRDIKNIVLINVAAAAVIVGFGLFHQIGMAVGFYETVEKVFYLVTGKTEIRALYSDYNMIGNLPRMVSLTGEPGYTGSYLLFIFAILLGLSYNVVGSGWRIRRQKIVELGLLFGMMMTGSTTAYLGLFLVVIVLTVFPKLLRLGTSGSRLKATALLTVFLTATLVMFVLAAPIILETPFWDYVYHTHYAKLFEQQGSGSVRSISVLSGAQVFLQSPILGVGYGSHRTASLLTSLLSNVGLVGTLAFFWLNFLVFRRGLRVCQRSSNDELVSIVYALLVSLATLLPVMLIAKSLVALVQGWYWLLLAMVEACYQLFRRESAPVVEWQVSAPPAAARDRRLTSSHDPLSPVTRR